MAEEILSYTLHARLISYPSLDLSQPISSQPEPAQCTPWFAIDDLSSPPLRPAPPSDNTAEDLLAAASSFVSPVTLCISPLSSPSETLTHETISLPEGSCDSITLPRLWQWKLRWQSWLAGTRTLPRGPISSLRGAPVNIPIRELESLDVEDGPAILLAEDNVINQKILRALCARRVGITAFKVVENGQLALEAYKQNPELYRCIFMDKAMPVMAGDEATVRIREFESANGLERAVIVSMCAGNAFVPDDRFSAHYDYFIDKPLRSDYIIGIFDGIAAKEATH